MTTFAQLLCREMHARNIQTKELARRLGVSAVCIQHWRNGKWLPKVPQALALGRILSMSVEEMFAEIPVREKAAQWCW